MLSAQFFLLTTLMVLAYGIQGSLQAKYIRKYDALSVGIIRNLSLAATMLPLLLFVDIADIFKITEYLGTFVLASFTGAIGLWCSFSSSHYLPIGMGTALRQVMHTLSAVALGALFFSELLSPFQLLLLGLIVFSGISLILVRVEHKHLDARYISRGVGLAMFAGTIVACSFYLLSHLSREIHPLVAAYFWEVGVGVALVALSLIRNQFRSTNTNDSVSLKDALTIVSISLLTILGTVAYASAATQGPYALVSGLMSMTTLVAVAAGWFLYKEHVSKLQGCIIAFSIICVLSLKLLS